MSILSDLPQPSVPAGNPTHRPPLDAILAPRSVAIIGATEAPGSVGAAVTQNLTSSGFVGKVFPVNPKRDQVIGRKSYPDVLSIDEPLDLAVIATPARTVPAVVEQCVRAKIPGAVIISAGFKEIGEPGRALERQVLRAAREGGMRIVGPNCLGVMNPHVGLNATFASAMARRGSVGFISQSGALCTAILDWSFRQKIGFSSFVSVGSMLDVGWADLIDYLGDDPHTKSIVMYMESIGDARSFLSAAREVALSKPIIVIKVGRSEAASQAAASHTGALTGSDEVLDAAFRRAGVLRVNTIAELFDMVDVLARQPRPAGPRLTMVTNAGGPGVLATDMLITSGGELAPVSPEAMTQLNDLLPAHWSHNNPIDVLGDAGPDRYAKAIEIASKLPESNGTLVIFTPQAVCDPVEAAKKIACLKKDGKPVLASFMGGDSVAGAEAILRDAGIPSYEFPDSAARAFCYMWQYSRNIDALYETPALAEETGQSATRRQCASRLIASARAEQRTILDEHDSKRLLEAYGIPTVPTVKVKTIDEAIKSAAQLGFPVVVKLISNTITHKSDVGGVMLNLRDADAVRRAFESIRASVAEKFGAAHFQGVSVQPMIRAGDGYEIILGSSVDPQFGPVLMFGTGGKLVEIFKDRALGLPPLNCTLARRMIEQTKIYKAFEGVRGNKPVDLDQLESIVVRFAELVIDQPMIKEIDINPLLVSGEQIMALDARVILHDPDVSLSQLPRPAIRPYPVRYVQPFSMKNDDLVSIRPIRPEDEPLMIQFHHTLSDETVRQRYFGTLKLSERMAHNRLRRICFTDYDREIVLVAEHIRSDGAHEILGVGRLSKGGNRQEAEFAVVIGTPWQGQGLGTELLQRLVKIGMEEKLCRITGRMFAANHQMIAVAKEVGFDVTYEPDGATCGAVMELSKDRITDRAPSTASVVS